MVRPKSAGGGAWGWSPESQTQTNRREYVYEGVGMEDAAKKDLFEKAQMWANGRPAPR